MSKVDAHSQSTQYLSILRQHVLDPVTTASTVAAHEQAEIIDEQEAFEEFATRVQHISTVSSKLTTGANVLIIDESPSSRTEALRTAYKNTVMDVSHYNAVYGESLDENVVAEFGPEFAQLFRSSTGISFTDQHKEALLADTERRVEERAECRDTLETEEEVLTSLRQDLTTVLDELDTTVLPSWYQQQFDEQIEEILSTRQSLLGRRSSLSRLDGHTLCEYLYADKPWTYPVLTAVGRLLNTIVVQD